MRRLRRHSPIGVDLASGLTRIVQLTSSAGRWRVQAIAACAAGPGERLDEKSPSGREHMARRLKAMLSSAPFKGRKAVLAAPRSEVELRPIRLELPPERRSNEDIWRAVSAEAPKYLSSKSDESVIDFMGVQRQLSDDNGHVDVVAVAANKKSLWARLQTLQLAGLSCNRIDAAPCAIARLSLLGEGRQGMRIIVEIGPRTTVIGISDSWRLVFARSLRWGTEDLTALLATELGVSEHIAREFQNQLADAREPSESIWTPMMNEDGMMDARQLSAALLDICRGKLLELAGEVRRTIDYFYSRFASLQGGGLELYGVHPGLERFADFLRRHLALPVQVGDPFRGVAVEKAIERIPSADRVGFAVAVGLALRGDV